MMKRGLYIAGVLFGVLGGWWLAPAAPSPASVLPDGVRVVWDLGRAERLRTPTRERICLNGLWRFQPAAGDTWAERGEAWGFFKVPGSWPGITDYMQKDCQTLFTHPAWKGVELGKTTAAWQEREFEVPADWVGRRMALRLELVHSSAAVWVDGQPAGEVRFPAGEVDLTALCQPGKRHTLTLLVQALPLKDVLFAHTDTFGVRAVPGSVARRGLCGDVFLTGEPAGPRVADVRVHTSVRRGQLGFDVDLAGLDPEAEYELTAEVTGEGEAKAEFRSRRFRGAEAVNGRFQFGGEWRAEKLWDLHTPGHQKEAVITLLDGQGRGLDRALPERFGFREFWIEGRDFMLNGSRIFLCAVPLDNAQMGAAWASYAGARESLQRLKSFGVNFVYTHNYGCEPGAHLSFAEVLRAADDEGVLVALSQPHFGEYDWTSADADRTNGYALHAAYYTQVAQNHPSVVFYAMSHNSVGTIESMNPFRIDGRQDERDSWSANNAKKAVRAEAIVEALDPHRVVYHHSSGNLGTMHTVNFYANFAPIQELSDWFQHWSRHGVKPLFLCEYGAPISWDWAMYRGWYKGVREFGSARVPWELCLAEWNAQFLGEAAYAITDLERDCLRWEAAQFRAGRTWHRWDYPRNAFGSAEFEARNEVFARYLTENLRAFRTLEVSAFCPWDHGIYWRLRDGVNRGRKVLPVDWDALQQPGFSADYVDDQMAWMNAAYERGDWVPTAGGEALIRNNGPLLAYLGGKPGAVTARDHNFFPGETVEKQVVVLNNSRQTVTAVCRWRSSLGASFSGTAQVTVETGQQARIPVRWEISPDIAAGSYELEAHVAFSNGEAQADRMDLHVLSRGERGEQPGRVALWDPVGETAVGLRELGIRFTEVDPGSSLDGFDVLVIGKRALDGTSAGPDLGRVRDGLRVLVFEQGAQALEQRLGFRVAEYGLRNVFPRVPDHPVLAGLAEAHFQNWRGEATLQPAQLAYQVGKRNAPEVTWCGLPVTRVWRAGNRGNVASVLIEKPARGDFLPVLDGGFGLQFSPLLEYREGQGLILFCQLDVTGRTEPDPAADRLARNLLRYVRTWQPEARRKVVYVGAESQRKELEKAGFDVTSYQGLPPGGNEVVVVGPGAEGVADVDRRAVASFAQSGGGVLLLGLPEAAANAWLPAPVRMREQEHVAASFGRFPRGSTFAGLSPAEVFNRDPRTLALVTSGAEVVGNGVLARVPGTGAVLCQLLPADFAGSDLNPLRRTYRRASVLVTRLLANLGAESQTPLLDRLQRPPAPAERRWRHGFYLDEPVEWDDPYRFFCW